MFPCSRQPCHGVFAMVFLNALESMLSITLLSLVGYMLAWKGWISREVEIFIPRFITQVVIPPYLMSSVLLHFNHDSFLSLIVESVVPMISLIISFLLFLALGRLLGMDKKHLNLAAVGAATSNTIFIGIPVNNALFGEQAITHLLLYFLGNTLFFWTVGNFAIAREGTKADHRLTRRELLQRIFSAPLLGTLTGIALLLLNVPVPRFVTETCSMLGGLGTPLALIFVGVILRRIDWKTAHMGKDIILTLTGRIILAPLIMIGLIRILPMQLPTLAEQVYIIQAGLPSMTQIALLSAFYGADKEFGSVFVCLSSIVGMISVPIWMTIISTWL